MKIGYNPARNETVRKPRINLTSLFSWLTVLTVIVFFWAAVVVIYKRDYVSHAIAKIQYKEKKFLAIRKALRKKLSGNHTLL